MDFFRGQKILGSVQPQINEAYEKSRLADRINRINSFDSSIWNLSHTSSTILKRKSLDELTRLNYTLENRLSELTIQKQRQASNPRRDELEASKWTGQKLQNMSDLDFDRFQRYDDGR